MFSKIETILKSEIEENTLLATFEFETVEDEKKNRIIKKVTIECRKCAIGALYEDFDGIIYSFDSESRRFDSELCCL
ncbi:MAG: hypothetical protein ACTTKP_05555 [Catonella sp.]|uniref:hypothetical protein n=1 Tax=Catonella sp. TaxID=2382125 RepID=UPI003F9EFE7C